MLEESPAIGALAPWFGAKRTLAPAIVEAIGPHSVYWELFCGSMAVLFAKPSCKTEIVNDLHGDLVNLARCVQSPILGPRLYRQLRRTLSCEDLFREAIGRIRGEARPPSNLIDLGRAYDYFLASWQGMNGVAGVASSSTGFARRFSSLGGDSGKRWVGAVASIPAWRRRLQKVQILSSDGIELASRIEDREGTAIYADPPYLVKGAKYLHDFASEDHSRLAQALARFTRTRVVVSYYDHPRLAELYPGWNVRYLEVAKSMVNSGMRDRKGAASAPEVLLCNQPFRPSQRPGLFTEEGA